MKNLKYFFLFSFLIFISCQKDSSSDSPEPPIDEVVEIPHLYIATETGEDIIEKSTYLNASLTIEGTEKYEGFEGEMRIRGRGNSTWNHPKKPYRLKLDSKASLFGLSAYKDWILLSDYLDGSMLYNSVPFETGRLLGIPYTHHPIPVEMTINDEYRGVYTFMEHKEVGTDRIDIGADGVLLEIDTYFDEDWQFRSAGYNLPVMIQFPESDAMTSEKLEEIQNYFETFESLVKDVSFPNNHYLDYFDDVSFVNYMIVYELTLNREINHPKSTYMNQLSGGKLRMGILWDFDWGFGYQVNQQHYELSTANTPLFVTSDLPGTNFFGKLMEDPHLQQLFKQRWQWFKSNHFDALKNHVKDYAKVVKLGYHRDHEVWGPRNASGNPDVDLENLLSWLDARAAYIDDYVADF